MSDGENQGAGPAGAEAEGDAELGLEKRLERLEEIARELERGDVGLEKALSLFEEGVRHVRHSQELLSRAELRVKELVGEGDDAEARTLEGADRGGADEDRREPTDSESPPSVTGDPGAP